MTDFADAPAEHMPEDDDRICKPPWTACKALNARHAPNGPPPVLPVPSPPAVEPGAKLLDGLGTQARQAVRVQSRAPRRPRHQLRGHDGRAETLPFIRYVITLDADTKLPRETAQRLVGTLAHPLNQPRFDPQARPGGQGYGIFSRASASTSRPPRRSLFARVWTGSAGIDPYTAAVSDVYKDLFGTGSFTGKGHLRPRRVRSRRRRGFPENCILSHDLIEGNFARCGLVTDIELLDDFPARYHVYARREHRWARGDWQLLPWLFRKVPTARRTDAEIACPSGTLEDHRQPAPQPRAACAVLLLLPRLDGPAWLALGWDLLALVVIGLPLILQIVGCAASSSSSAPLGVLREFRRNALATGGQVFLIADLPARPRARHLTDAMVRTW